MRTTALVNDSLWRCLCPHFTSNVARRPFVSPQSTSTSRSPSQSRCYASELPVHPLSIKPDARERGLLYQPGARPVNKGEPEIDFFQYVTKKAKTHRHNEESAMEELRIASEKLDYVRAQAIVKYLVEFLGVKPSEEIYQHLIHVNVCASFGSAAEVESLLAEMERGRIDPGAETYHAILKVLSIHPDQLLRDHILARIQKRWITLSKEGHHDVVAGLIRDRHLELALDWIDRMPREGIVIEEWLYDILVYALCEVEEFDEALRIMQHRTHTIDASQWGSSLVTDYGGDKYKISTNVWSHFLDTVSRAFHYEATRFAYNARVEKGYLNLPAGMSMNVLQCAARCGDTKLATSAFNELAKVSGNHIKLHHYECLLESYINASDLQAALSLASTTEKGGYALTPGSLRSIFLYLGGSNERCLEAMQILESMRSEDKYVPLASLHIVLEALIDAEDLTNAFHIYETISTYHASSSTADSPVPLKPNVDTFNYLLRGCHLKRDKSKAMFLASEMSALNVAPNELTYDRLILICLDSRMDLDDAWRYVQEMREAGLEMSKGTASLMVEVASRASDRRVFLLSAEEGGSMPMDVFDRLIKEHWRARRPKQAYVPPNVQTETPSTGLDGESEQMQHPFAGAGLS